MCSGRASRGTIPSDGADYGKPEKADAAGMLCGEQIAGSKIFTSFTPDRTEPCRPAGERARQVGLRQGSDPRANRGAEAKKKKNEAASRLLKKAPPAGGAFSLPVGGAIGGL